LPKVFIDWASVPEDPGVIDPDEIDTNREEWIQSWTEVVLR
jgi:ABC-type thiamine transport system substrate-binding protein